MEKDPCSVNNMSHLVVKQLFRSISKIFPYKDSFITKGCIANS